MSDETNPEIVDSEKTVDQLIVETNARLVQLAQDIQEMRKGVDEAKALPETQNAKKTLENIEELGTKAKATLSAIVQDAKTATEASASANKSDAEVTAILKMIKTREDECRAIQDKIAEELELTKVNLSKTIEDSNAKIQAQHKEIEKIIPGAITAKLASSFKKRKDEIAEYGWVWTLLLVVASLGLVAVGIFAIMNPGDHFWSTLPARAIVVLGLLFIEEFARRNYNVKFRLSEAYAYRQALAEFFYGYRDEIKAIRIKDGSNAGHEVDAEKRLVEIFMEELSEEPSSEIFEKEKTSLASEKILEQIAELLRKDESILAKITNSSLLTKISWPMVVIFAILTFGAVVTIYICK